MAADPAGAGAHLPFAFARDHQVILTGGRMILGPGGEAAALAEVRRAAGAPLAVEEVDAAAFARLLDAHYSTVAGQAEDSGADIAFDLEETETGARVQDLLEDAAEAPVIELVNQLLRRAVRAGASDLHVEPLRDGIRARMRLDGTLYPILEREDVPVRRIVSRLKVMAGLDTSETRLPQDGRIALRFGGRAIDLRFSSLPGQHGERLVLRILDRQAGIRALDDLGLSPAQAAQLRRLAGRPNGIVLATGPTGSGKTTTLYSLLHLIDRRERNVVTVEDPIEYELPGISQSQVNPDIGLTFAAGLRATLRQDPDVILVGEIRDQETAKVAAQAALTGHLVLSSLHANGTLGAVTRLRDLGLDDYLIASTLRGVLAQRLVRRLCPACARAEPPAAELAHRLTAAGIPVPAMVRHAVGCPACSGTGHAGRVGIFEVAEIPDPMAAAIGQGAAEAELRALLDPGAETMTTSALRRIAAGEVSPEELARVLGDL
ncbi:GspE/PulE family protein [Ruixingdingia sedimenti]|uniref:GspE/PulE family protein n=1 Tax=Ruixingdingia sedimenti TaxID=3073604 RepID=A0ABU1F6A4_9RHOB|nr:GspE/PulE family protein [Xinfangfangia sp. LG-4]MDR5651969.1 GspE/PulE family protein [Xinfangfangia sp. LG-4]